MPGIQIQALVFPEQALLPAGPSPQPHINSVVVVAFKQDTSHAWW